jgi:hypothetical protein
MELNMLETFKKSQEKQETKPQHLVSKEITLTKQEIIDARKWREGKITEILNKLKRGKKINRMEEAFTIFCKEGWILSLKWN